MAFGEVDIETDQPTMPMLSGAGSRTWVEHTMAQPTAATVEVNAQEVDASSDLEVGTVPAGGFRLELGRARQSSPPLLMSSTSRPSCRRPSTPT